jgi:hypothetical protein
MYGTGVVAIIREMDLVEFSIVSKPAQPDARIQRQSINTADLQAASGEQWEPGKAVSCAFRLRPCRGLVCPRGLALTAKPSVFIALMAAGTRYLRMRHYTCSPPANSMVIRPDWCHG